MHRNSLFVQNRLRGSIDETQRRHPGAFRRNNVAVRMPRDRLRHLAAHAIPHTDEKHAYRFTHDA